MTEPIPTPAADADERMVQHTYDSLVWHCLSTELSADQRSDQFERLSQTMALVQQIVPRRTLAWDLAHRLKIRADQESVLQRRGETIIG